MSSIYLPYQKLPKWNIDQATIAYNCAQLGLPIPVLAMPMLEGAGTNTFDLIPQYKCPFTGTIVWTINNIDFGTATDCHIDLISSLQLNSTKPFTIAFAYKMNVASVVNAIFTLKTDTTEPFSCFIYNAGDYLPIAFGSNAGWKRFRPTENFWADWAQDFQTVTVTFDGVDHTALSSYRIYYNGIDKALGDAGVFNATAQVNRIGKYGNSAHWAKGLFKYFHVWPEKALSASQAQIFHNNNFGLFEPIRSPQWIVPLGATTAAPTTLAPTSLAPTSLAPTSLAPTTAAPTLAPTTLAPTSAAPTTTAPTTAAPTTSAPTTGAPTPAPTTVIPTLAPTTVGPTTIAPTTLAPTTGLPEEICIKEFNSTITKEISFKSVITKEIRSDGHLC